MSSMGGTGPPKLETLGTMRVKHCYVFGFGNFSLPLDAETAAVAAGLYAKYSPRCGSAALIHYTNAVTIEQATGAIPLIGRDTVGEVVGEYKHVTGAYLVLHAVEGMSFVEESEIIAALEGAIPAPTLACLQKLVLVACFAADSKAASANLEGKELTELANPEGQQRSVLLSLLIALNAKGITPMLAGWDCFVTAAPYRPTKIVEHQAVGQTVYGTPTGTKGQFSDEQLQSADYVGKKIVHGSRYGFVSDNFRAQHKRVYWVQDGRLHIDGESGWSDKQ